MPARILVVDDSPTIRRIVTTILARQGHSCTEAADGEMALAMLQLGQTFDLVLLDFVMPKKNGYQFCRELSTALPDLRLPIVLMSAKAEDIRERFLEQTGAIDSIGKPFDAEALSMVVEHALTKANQPTEFSGEQTMAFIAPEHVRKRAARSSEVAMVNPESSVVRSLEDGATSEGTFFTEDELPFDDRSSNTTQRIDEMTLAFGKLAEQLDGLFGHSKAEIHRELVERMSSKALRDVFSVYAELEPAASLRGSLSVFSAATVLQFIATQELTGVLSFRQHEMNIEVVLGEGKVDLVHASGAPLEFRLGRYFVTAGLLGQAELDDFLASAPPPSSVRVRPLGERLVDAQRISRRSLHEVLSLQSTELVYEALRWFYGTFEFRAGERLPLADRARLALHTPTLLLEGLRRAERWRDIEANLGNFDDVIALVPGLSGMNTQGFSESEVHVLRLADGERTIREVIAASSLSSFDVCRILAQFKGSGVVITKEQA